MPSDFGQNRLMFRLLSPGLALLLLGSTTLTLSGCDWLPKPQPGPEQHQPVQTPASDVVGVYFSKYQGSQSIVESVPRKLAGDTEDAPDVTGSPRPVGTPVGTDVEPLSFALSELLKGPTSEEKSQGFYSEIPKGTRLLGVTKDAKTIHIDLSAQFSTGGGSTSITQRLEELKRTVKAVDASREVVVLVEGKPLETLGGEGLEVPGTMQSGPQ